MSWPRKLLTWSKRVPYEGTMSWKFHPPSPHKSWDLRGGQTDPLPPPVRVTLRPPPGHVLSSFLGNKMFFTIFSNIFFSYSTHKKTTKKCLISRYNFWRFTTTCSKLVILDIDLRWPLWPMGVIYCHTRSGDILTDCIMQVHFYKCMLMQYKLRLKLGKNV